MQIKIQPIYYSKPFGFNIQLYNFQFVCPNKVETIYNLVRALVIWWRISAMANFAIWPNDDNTIYIMSILWHLVKSTAAGWGLGITVVVVRIRVVLTWFYDSSTCLCVWLGSYHCGYSLSLAPSLPLNGPSPTDYNTENCSTSGASTIVRYDPTKWIALCLFHFNQLQKYDWTGSFSDQLKKAQMQNSFAFGCSFVKLLSLNLTK